MKRQIAGQNHQENSLDLVTFRAAQKPAVSPCGMLTPGSDSLPLAASVVRGQKRNEPPFQSGVCIPSTVQISRCRTLPSVTCLFFSWRPIPTSRWTEASTVAEPSQGDLCLYFPRYDDHLDLELVCSHMCSVSKYKYKCRKVTCILSQTLSTPHSRRYSGFLNIFFSQLKPCELFLKILIIFICVSVCLCHTLCHRSPGAGVTGCPELPSVVLGAEPPTHLSSQPLKLDLGNLWTTQTTGLPLSKSGAFSNFSLSGKRYIRVFSS